MRHSSQLCILVALTLLVAGLAGCTPGPAVTSTATAGPAATATAGPSATVSSATASPTASGAATPTGTQTPGATPTGTQTPGATPTSSQTPPPMAGNGLTLDLEPDRLWGLQYPAGLLHREELDPSIVLFISSDRSAFAAVDSYDPAIEQVSNPETLRDRARDALAKIYGQPVKETKVLDVKEFPWVSGISFTTAGGAKGETLYMQPGLEREDTRVYGVLYGYKAADEQSVLPQLETVRGSFKPANLLVLEPPAGSPPLWAIASYGQRSFAADLDAEHFVAIYTRNDQGWQLQSHQLLATPDYVAPTSVQQVKIENSRVWLQIDAGIGAHGGSFHLLSYANRALKTEIEHTNASPGAGQVTDLTGDGKVEVVLDETDPYVFCYACSVRYAQSRVLQWDGSRLAEVKLAKLPDSAPAELRRLTNRAVELAEGGLFKDAQSHIEQAQAIDPQNATVAMNAALIKLQAVPLAEQARTGPYALLGHVFYGDYAAALDVMRRYKPAQLFDPKGPLITGTPAETWENTLSEWMVRSTSRALGAQSDLAGAYYLRGWARRLANPSDPAALADIERAAQLAPKETLFSDSVAYLKK